MYDFIKLTNLVDKNAIFVNPRNVESISNGMNKGARLRFISGGAIEVKESPEKVNDIISKIGMVFLTGTGELNEKERYLNTVDVNYKENKDDT